MKLLFCHCRQCRYGRKNPYQQARIHQMQKAHRSTVRRLLKQGRFYALPTAIPVGYTD